MSNKKYDPVVVTGEYTKSQGEVKKQYKNVGAIMSNDKGFYMILDRTFNPAGLPNPDNKSGCFISLFEPKDKQQAQQSAPQGQSVPSQPVVSDNFSDDIPW